MSLPLALLLAATASAATLEDARRRYRADFFELDAHVELADALYREGRLIDGYYVLDEARGFFPQDRFDRAHARLILAGGEAPWGAGALDASPERYGEIKARVDYEPGDAAALAELAHIEGSRGRAAEAEVYADRALRADPAQAGALGLKAHLRARAKDEAGALAAFEKLCALGHDGPDMRSGLEFMEELAARGVKGGETSRRALASLKRLAAAQPGNAHAFSSYAVALWRAGDEKSARALAKGAPRPGAALLRGLLFIQDKRWLDAAYWLEASLKDDPESRLALSKLASLSRNELKDPAAALKWYLLLFRLDPHFYDGEYAEWRVKRWLNARRDHAAAAATSARELRALLLSSDGDLRAEAALQAGKRKERELLPELLARLDDDVGVVTQNADYAAFELAKAYPGVLAPHAADLLGSDAPFVRGKALNLFGDLDVKSARPYVLKGFSDPDAYVRFRAHIAARGYYAADRGVQAAAAKARLREGPAVRAALERASKRR